MQLMSSRAMAAARDGNIRFARKVTLLGTAGAQQTGGGEAVPDRNLDVLAGAIEVSALDPIRRTFTATLIDRTGDLVPKTITDPLMPFGAEVRVEVGYQYADGTVELWPQGVFVLTDVEVSDEGDALLIDVEGSDRAERFSRPSATPDSIVSGTNNATAIRNLLTKVWSGASFALGQMQYTAPNLLIAEGEDRWEKARDLAIVSGHELFLDVEGRVASCPTPALTSSANPAWTFSDEGEPALGLTPQRRPTALSIVRAIHAENMPNGVVVSGSNTSAGPVRGEFWDMDPLSPTFRFGRYGERPRFESSDKLGSNDQARDMARSLLNQVLGQAEELEFTALGLPALDVGDVVLLDRPRAGIDRRLYLLDRMTIPLTPDETISVSARSQVAERIA